MIEFGKMFTVSVDPTEIEEEGRRRIGSLLTNYDLPPLPEGWSWSRLVRTGDFRGRFPKRVATYYKKVYGEKVPPSILERIGNRVNQYSFDGKDYTLDFTEQLNWSAGDFGDYGSCYWGCRRLAREALMENGVIAVRFFREDGKGYARAFVIRLKDGMIVFNAYGLPCRVIAYVLATLFDYPYREEVDLYIKGDPGGLIWLNEDAYHIGHELPEKSISVSFEVPYDMCNCCETFYSVDEGDYNSYDEFVCFECQ